MNYYAIRYYINKEDSSSVKSIIMKANKSDKSDKSDKQNKSDKLNKQSKSDKQDRLHNENDERNIVLDKSKPNTKWYIKDEYREKIEPFDPYRKKCMWKALKKYYESYGKIITAREYFDKIKKNSALEFTKFLWYKSNHMPLYLSNETLYVLCSLFQTHREKYSTFLPLWNALIFERHIFILYDLHIECLGIKRKDKRNKNDKNNKIKVSEKSDKIKDKRNKHDKNDKIKDSDKNDKIKDSDKTYNINKSVYVSCYDLYNLIDEAKAMREEKMMGIIIPCTNISQLNEFINMLNISLTFIKEKCIYDALNNVLEICKKWIIAFNSVYE